MLGLAARRATCGHPSAIFGLANSNISFRGLVSQSRRVHRPPATAPLVFNRPTPRLSVTGLLVGGLEFNPRHHAQILTWAQRRNFRVVPPSIPPTTAPKTTEAPNSHTTGQKAHDPVQSKPPPSPPRLEEAAPTAARKPSPDAEPTKSEQRRTDWTIISKLLENVWPRNDWKTRGTVIFGFVLLISGKVRYVLC